RVNVLVCCIAIMYFNTEAQSWIIARFHFALADQGVLFLGKAEMLLTHSALFAPIDLRRRVFRKVAKDNWRERMAIMTQANGDDGFDDVSPNAMFPAVFDVSPNAQFVVDGNGMLAMFNERARAQFGLAPSDLGRPFQDLEVSYRPAELRSVLAQVIEQRRPTVLRDVHADVAGQEGKFYDVHVVPVN